MRTTVDIPDALGRQMKIRAAQEGQPLKVFIARALERELTAPATTQDSRTTPTLPVIKSSKPGSLKITPQELSELLAKEEIAAYAADVRH